MKKIDFKCLVAGFILGIVGVTTVFAASGIKSTFLTDTKIFMKDTPVALSESPIMVVKEGSETPVTYIPLRDFFEKSGYDVIWNGENKSVQLYPKPFSVNFGLEEFRRQPLPLIAADHDEDVYLYTLQSSNSDSISTRGAIITYQNLSQYFDWHCMSARLIPPQIKIFDYDSDAKKEIAVALNNGSGTSINIDELHLLKLSESNFIDYKYEPDLCQKELEERITHNFYNMDGKIRITLTTDGGNTNASALSIDLSALYPDEDNPDAFQFFIHTGIQTFKLEENGRIEMNVDLCVCLEDGTNRQSIATVTADVIFSNEHFSLSNIKLTTVEMSNSTQSASNSQLESPFIIEDGVLLKFADSSHITDIVIPPTVTKIVADAFPVNNSIRTIDFRGCSSALKIEPGAFSRCLALHTVNGEFVENMNIPSKFEIGLINGTTIPVSGKPSAEYWQDLESVEISQADVESILSEAEYNGVKMFFYRDPLGNIYLAYETRTKTVRLLQTYNHEERWGYTYGYKISLFENVLGHNGFVVDYPVGAAFESIEYFALIDGQPEPIADCVNQQYEVDLDGDGQKELISEDQKIFSGVRLFIRDGLEIKDIDINNAIETHREFDSLLSVFYVEDLKGFEFHDYYYDGNSYPAYAGPRIAFYYGNGKLYFPE